jgi:hypothetical protein
MKRHSRTSFKTVFDLPGIEHQYDDQAGPGFFYCGYPIRVCGEPATWQPCGQLATPGCAFCDVHGREFDAAHRAALTEEQIIDRACESDLEYGRWIAVGIFIILALLALWLPVHTWLHRHVELFAGILLGTLAQSIPWLIDRWRWLKWFSYQ